MTTSETKREPIRIALDRHWMTLHPGLQHTRNGDLVLSNQFDALVGQNVNGSPIPLGARSWEVLDSFKKYRFKIDTTRRYSDGSYLKAQDYKRSWEDAVRLIPSSSLNSTSDVLSYLEGFEKFAEVGELTGVRAVDDETLEVSFSKPLRLALDFLSGNRFAAFKQIGNGEKYIGTGHYIIENVDENNLRLTPNPYAHDSRSTFPITLSYAPAADTLKSIVNGQSDVLGYSAGDEAAILNYKSDKISAVVGEDAMHSILYLNGLKGRTFSDHNLRLALQWLVIERLISQSREFRDAVDAGFFAKDPQIYLPLQAGRLNDSETAQLIAAGEKSVAALIATSQKKPIRVWTSAPTAWLIRALGEAGVKLSEDSGVTDPKKRVQAFYKTFDADVIALNTSVVNSDPDGIYHVLGPKGAISSPMIQRETVGRLAEEGRGITDVDLINPHYLQLSRAVLTEVPFIHLGFAKSVSLVRADAIEIENGIVLRNQGHFHVFKRKR